MLALEPRRGGIPKRGSRGARIRHSDSGLHDVVEDRPSVNFSPSGTCEPVADIGALRAADKILRVYNNGTPKSGNLAAALCVFVGRLVGVKMGSGRPPTPTKLWACEPVPQLGAGARPCRVTYCCFEHAGQNFGSL
jgi:hypothetical protein